jgi:hypothetical protein
VATNRVAALRAGGPLSGRRLTAPLGVLRGSLVPHPTAEEARMTDEQQTRLAEQIAALHDIVAELADTWDNGGGPDHEPTRAQLEQLTLHAAVHLLRVRDALQPG